jgi:hypothetical protein
VGTDTAAVRWQLGEDLPPATGVVRDMQDPTTFGDPDRTGSIFYTADEDEVDSGGVHSNSGVNNKAAYLMTDGGSFNSQTITGLGAAKVGQIYYKVETSLLTSASDYQDLGDALQAACTSLIGAHGITSNDCDQVRKAVLATEMDQTPTNAAAPEAPVCGAGTAPFTLFYDDLESASANWQHSATIGQTAWYYPMSPNDIFGSGAYATSGDNNIWGYDRPTRTDSNIRMNISVALPTNAYLRFNQAYGFEDGFFGGVYYTVDGGVVEYSTNNGASWIDAGPLFTDNSGYNGAITDQSDNPLGGKSAFVAESNGYISSRLNLASLAGQSVRFRFRIGTDTGGDDYGWFIDEVHIYRCTPIINGPNKVYLSSVIAAN